MPKQTVFEKLTDWFRAVPSRSTLSPLSDSNSNIFHDTLSAIEELTLVAKKNPDLLEITFALGNLYRSQGNTDRAVYLHNTILARPTISIHYRQKALYELGIDFKRAGLLDKAYQTLLQADEIAGKDPAIIIALAEVSSKLGNYEESFRYYNLLKNKQEAAYNLFLSAQDMKKTDQNLCRKTLFKAIKVYPKLIEAWLELLYLDLEENEQNNFLKKFKTILETIPQNLVFIIFEKLFAYQIPLTKELCIGLNELLDNNPFNISFYYQGLLSLKIEQPALAKNFFEQMLTKNNDFLPARVELLRIIITQPEIQLDLANNLNILFEQGRKLPRFICSQCGLALSSLYFTCPRCSATYSFELNNTCTELNE